MEFASRIVQTEFRRFTTREDHRVTDTLTGKKQTKSANPDAQVPCYLQFESKEVTADSEVLTSNLITELKTRFQTEVFCLSLIFFHLPPAYLCTDATFVYVVINNVVWRVNDGFTNIAELNLLTFSEGF